MHINTIGDGLVAGSLGDLYLFIKSSIYNEYLEQILRTAGLKTELDIIQAVVDDFANVYETKSIKVSSTQVKDNIEQILKEITAVQTELEYHKTRYFSNWRTPAIDEHIVELTKLKDYLTSRRELLVSVLGVQRRTIKPLPQLPKRSIFQRLDQLLQ